ncbi:M23 family metallopeptidase [Microbacterium pumilum]|uniref:M23ase beta-sheet core domain-containing protein n=1 Tax=Microbacterium pumilum TaxID=344165 RepID=A0ABP5DFD8_9MICO
MGAPVAVAILAKTRIGRKLLVAAFIAIGLAVVLAITPIIAIPLAVAGSTASSAITGQVDAVTVGDWTYPLDGAYSKGRGFGYNPVIGCGYCSTNHQGYDMAQGCSATIYAAGPGRVITAGPYQGYGNAVLIDHGEGLITLYGHMQWGSLRVGVGSLVNAGTPLGAEGNTGKSYGCHLHFEVRQNGAAIDPAPFMAARGLPLT